MGMPHSWATARTGFVGEAQLASALVNIAPEEIVEFVRAHRALKFGSLDDQADESVRVCAEHCNQKEYRKCE